MINKPPTQQHTPRRPTIRQGLSLIEVVASIALLALLMVSLLTGWQRHRKLAERSQQKLDAAERLDEQMGRWFAVGGGPPVNAQGTFDYSDLKWTSQVTPGRGPLPSGLVPVTVEVNSPRYARLLSIEVVVPNRLRASDASPDPGPNQ